MHVGPFPVISTPYPVILSTYHEYFNDNIVSITSLHYNESEYTNTDNKDYINASIQIQLLNRTHRFEHIGIKHAGAYTLSPSVNDTFIIDLSHNFKQSFEGLQKFKFRNPFNFDPDLNDSAVIQEKIISDILIDSGCLAPRMSYTQMFVNHVFQGIYLVQEVIDKEYFENRNADFVKDGEVGTLWKMSNGGFSDSKIAYTDPKQPPPSQDWDDIGNRLQNATTLAEVSGILNIATFVRSMAINNLVCNVDCYPLNNYYLYHNPVDSQMYLVIHDLHFSFRETCDFSEPSYFTPVSLGMVAPSITDELTSLFAGERDTLIKTLSNGNFIHRMEKLFETMQKFTPQVLDKEKLKRMIDYPARWKNL